MNAIALYKEEYRFTPEQTALIKTTICKDATDDELKLFLYQAQRTGLDPLARQIYAVKRWDWKRKQEVMAIQTSIDGFRLIAERTGKYAGQVGPFWCGGDGVWRDAWVLDEAPTVARVGVLRSDFKEPCFGVARFGSYVQLGKDGFPTKMWKTMPDVMLAKCAEALALRKAFPQELSGLYSTDEMGQADNTLVPHANSNQAPVSEISPIAPVTIEKPPEHDPVTGEVGPRALPLPAGDTLWRQVIAWGASYIAALNGAQTLVELDQWMAANYATLYQIKETAPKVYDRIVPNIENARKKLILKETAAKPPKMDQAAYDDGIPPFLDRTSKQAPTPEDSEAYLVHIADTLADCSTSAQAIAVWDKFLPTLADMFPRDADIAGDVFERTLEALRKQELEAVS